jgi:hypothetical protein
MASGAWAPASDLLYLDEPWLTIIWDHQFQCVYAKFQSFATSAEFRAGTMKILAVLKQRRATSLVSDNRMLEGVSEQDQLWLSDAWVPLAVASGLKRIGVVLPKRGPGKIDSEEIIGQIGQDKFSMRTFDLLPDALSWAGSNQAK